MTGCDRLATGKDRMGPYGTGPYWLRSGFLGSYPFRQPVAVSVSHFEIKKPDRTGLRNTMYKEREELEYHESDGKDHQS